MEKGQRNGVIGCRAGVDHPCGLSIQEMLRKSHLDHWTGDQGLSGSRGEGNDQAFKTEPVAEFDEPWQTSETTGLR